jgi:hypothetical protein
LPPGQRFCNNCGTNIETGQPAGQPPSQYGGPAPQGQQPYQQAPYGQQYGQPGQQYGQQYNQQYGQQFGQPLQPYQQPQKSNPIAEALGAMGLLFFMRRYRPGYRPRRQSSGCCGCLVALVILGIIFGIPAYVYYRANPHVVQQIQSQIQNSSSGNSSNGSIPTTQPPITTAKINQTVNYSGVDITIVSVEQSTAFIDDSSTVTNGMVRLLIHENAGQKVGAYFYSDSARLILPDKTSVAPVSEQSDGGPNSGTSRDNRLDFPVPSSDKIDQLTLMLGTPQQAQIVIPLTGKANLTAFLSKTVNLNTPISYGGLNWMLASATRTPSAGGKQADAGMRFVVLTFKVDNPTANNIVIGFTDEYMRLKSGNITNSQTDSTMPLYANANTTGTTGTVTFSMPESDTGYTLILLAHSTQPQSSAPVNTDIKI